MNAWIRTGRAGKSLFAIAALFALSLRILVPAGFMPTASATGMVLALCSQADGKTVTIDLGDPGPGKKQHAADRPCVFATGLGHGLLTAASPAAILPYVYGVTAFVGTAIADLTVHRLAAPPPPSRGPPALS